MLRRPPSLPIFAALLPINLEINENAPEICNESFQVGGDINDFNDPPILIVVIDNKIRVKRKHYALITKTFLNCPTSVLFVRETLNKTVM